MVLDRDAVLDALIGAPSPQARVFRGLVESYPFIGVRGSAASGKTYMVSRVLRELNAPAVTLDLRRCASYEQLASQWARALATATLSDEAIFDVDVNEPRRWAPGTFDAVGAFTERFGPHIADLFQVARPERPAAEEHQATLSELAHATSLLGTEQQPAVLCIDHLEAPSLSFRHPVDVGDLLWTIRSVAQTQPALRIVVVCRPAAVELAAGEHAAFYGDGIWLTQELPTAKDYTTAALVAGHVADAIVAYTRGHVATTLDVLEHLEDRNDSYASILHVARRQHERGTLALDYARSIHRLGPHLLNVLAEDRGPYEASPGELPKTIAAAMNKLSLAGLIERTDDGEPLITDPRLLWWLNGGNVRVADTWTIVVRRSREGTGYEAIRTGAPQATLVRPTQKEAEEAARALLRRVGGGELIVRPE